MQKVKLFFFGEDELTSNDVTWLAVFAITASLSLVVGIFGHM